MAKLDEIKAQIHKAQAEAVRNAPSLSAANSGAVVKESQKIVKQNIAAQQAAKQTSNGQAETPALPEVTDTRTTQQKYDDAQKEYEGYINSDEYKQKRAEYNQTALREAMQRVFAAGASASDLPLGVAQVKPQVDTKEQELKAAVDHYKQQMDQEESQRIRDADMKEIESWSDEDQEQLRQYVSSENKTNNLFVNSNPLLCRCHCKQFTACTAVHRDPGNCTDAATYARNRRSRGNDGSEGVYPDGGLRK